MELQESRVFERHMFSHFGVESGCGCKSDPVSLDTVWTTMTAAKEAGHEGQGAEANHEVKWLGMTITPSYVGEPSAAASSSPSCARSKSSASSSIASRVLTRHTGSSASS